MTDPANGADQIAPATKEAASLPLVYTNGRRIFFAHVPKTSGSSVEDYLLRRFSDISLFRAEKRPFQRGVLPPPQHLTAEDLANLLPRQLDYSFAIVRDPPKRIVSEYKYQAGATRVSRISFANWLRVVLFTTALDPRSYDNHIRPQSDLVPDGAEIFCLENGLESIIPRLDEVTGSTAPNVAMGHLLKRDKQNPSTSRGRTPRSLQISMPPTSVASDMSRRPVKAFPTIP